MTSEIIQKSLIRQNYIKLDTAICYDFKDSPDSHLSHDLSFRKCRILSISSERVASKSALLRDTQTHFVLFLEESCSHLDKTFREAGSLSFVERALPCYL